MNIEIRQENENDFSGVFDVNKLAFGRENEANLVNLLRKSKAFIPELSLVATLGSEIVGYILFTKIQIVNAKNSVTESLALAPVAVQPNFQHKGIGGQLIKYGLNKAREMQYKSVIVLGHKNYYPRFGFEATTKWHIESPFQLSDSGNFMGMELVTDGLKNAQGLVKYPKEFEKA